MVKDPHWTPGYVEPPEQEMPVRIPSDGLCLLLSAAAFGGCSAFVDICFDVEPLEH
jgi:hypothetical protein